MKKLVRLMLLSIVGGLAALLSGCGGGGGGTASSAATISAANVIGTWKLTSVNSTDITPYNVSLVVDASTYTMVFPVSLPNGLSACTEYGTWSLSGDKLTTTPISGSTCGNSSSTSTLSISGTTMTQVAAGETDVYQRQTANSVTANALMGTWKMMAKDKQGTVTSLLSSNITLTLNGTAYSLSGINCSESGTWSINGNTLTLTPSAGSTCGNSTAYSEALSLNDSLLTQTDSALITLWQKQSGASNSAPASTMAAGAVNGGVNINWQLVGGATSYNVYRGTISGSLATKTFVASVASGTYLDTATTAGTTYYYQITSVGSFGESAPSVEISATATAATANLSPNPVVGLTAKPGDTTVTLFWNAVTGATSYNVYYLHWSAGTIVPAYASSLATTPASYSLNGWTKLPGTNITSPGYTVTGLVNGDTYQYMVTAVNANGESLSISYVDVTPAAPATTTWTSRTSGTAANLYDVAYVGNQFLAVGGGTTVGVFNPTDTAVMLSSTDGITWTNIPLTASVLTQVIWSQALSTYVAVGLNGTILTSPDAVTWTSRTSGTTNLLCGLTWSSALNLFVAVGNAGTILTSPDGVTWTPRTSGAPNTQLWRVKALGNKLFAMGRTNGSSIAGVMLTSADGITWTAVPGYTNAFYGIAYNGVSYVAVGSSPAAGSPATILTSPDAVTWTTRTSANTTGLLGVMWDGSQWVAYGFGGAVLTSPDGVTWTNRVTPTTSTLWGITGNGNRNVVVGDSGTIVTLP